MTLLERFAKIAHHFGLRVEHRHADVNRDERVLLLVPYNYSLSLNGEDSGNACFVVLAAMQKKWEEALDSEPEPSGEIVLWEEALHTFMHKRRHNLTPQSIVESAVEIGELMEKETP